MSDIEREVKFRLSSAGDYERLCARLPGFRGESLQENSYWDTPEGALASQGEVLRVRIEGDEAYLTLKGPATRTAAGEFSAREREEAIDEEQARSLLAGSIGIADLDSELIGAVDGEHPGCLRELREWGSLTNLRRRFEFFAGTTIEVDRTVFPGGEVEWEVEIESFDTARAAKELRELLDQLGVRAEPQTMTKVERLKALRRGR